MMARGIHDVHSGAGRRVPRPDRSHARSRAADKRRVGLSENAMRLFFWVPCLASVFVAGCLASQSWMEPESWTRAGVAAREVKRDTGGCLRAATTSPVVNSKGIVTSPGRVSKEGFLACMRSRGYEAIGGVKG